MDDKLEADESQSRTLFLAVAIPFVCQAVATTTLGLIANITGQAWIGTMIEPSFVITSGVGFYFLVRRCRPIERVLIAIGYFPLMLIADWVTALFIGVHLPGGQGNL